MINLPRFQDTDLNGKRVIIRADLDVDTVDGHVTQPARLECLLPTITEVLNKGAAKVLLVGHKGRPEEKFDEKFSLRPLANYFKEKISNDVTFVEYLPFDQYFQIQEKIIASPTRLTILENLRYWPGEEANDEEFTKQIAYGQDIYINDAFASSHREHASIVGLPKLLPHFAGVQFQKEIENLIKTVDNPKKPMISIISGVKKDKIEYIEPFKKFSDKILIGGRLPEFMPEDFDDGMVIVGKLNPDKEDLTIHSIEKFEEEISTAQTIFISGPPSYYEDPGHRLGTERILMAVVNNTAAFKVSGGGDTTAAIESLHLDKSFDWMSLGGGASLEFLSKGTLPGIEALLH